MKIHILDLFRGIKHVPLVPTYAIRIIGSSGATDVPLFNSPNYRTIREYIFDDVDPGYNPDPKSIMIDDSIASKVIDEFFSGREGCEELMVHCSRGQNRSPAVAIALNDSFNLGENSRDLWKRFPHTNHYVYEKIMEAHDRLK